MLAASIILSIFYVAYPNYVYVLCRYYHCVSYFIAVQYNAHTAVIKHMRYVTIFEEKVIGTVAATMIRLSFISTLCQHACVGKNFYLRSTKFQGGYSVTLCGSVPASPFFMVIYAVERKFFGSVDRSVELFSSSLTIFIFFFWKNFVSGLVTFY